MANIAPYLKNLSIASSSKLIQMASSFADPRLLFAEEGNPRLVYFMSVPSFFHRIRSTN
jgi:High-temperature-induced dauer-formation protein